MRRLLLLLAITVVLAACNAGGTETRISSSPAASAAASGGPEILPILVSSELTKGPTRFLFSLTDKNNNLIAAPDVKVHLQFYYVDTAEDTVVFESDGRFLWAIEGQRGLYATDVSYPDAGRWGTRFTATLTDGSTKTVRANYDVVEVGSTVAIGAKAPSVKTPTIAGIGDIHAVSSDKTPVARFYTTSVDEALVANAPFVLVFATPAFCQTAICGPTLETVKTVATDYPDVTFINVEPYQMTFENGSLQPALDASGQLQSAAWTDAFGLQTEPWIFVIGGDGTVRAKFEAVIGADELRTAIDAAVAG